MLQVLGFTLLIVENARRRDYLEGTIRRLGLTYGYKIHLERQGLKKQLLADSIVLAISRYCLEMLRQVLQRLAFTGRELGKLSLVDFTEWA